ncbi:MAG TPA: helix-turn-helix domain-containing protein [Stackebrandtia sp.]|jgi:DNA-binding transcriptional ArsR family regulator|uniref:helix-turn-helix domain-containing protein n=1 Tax=Stackebrandtia sp. TaxID=2023065 RepID=UPI002D343FF1|nr:helix-turn-helix domain-containing protein [Stackebrandtia sp.]HZE39186.1 helix-turn-helix domain-containing protein [Stackebrandtia sp.]
MSEAPDPKLVRLDARNLRGVAHPIRVRMLGLLRAEGPATATGLAQRLGLNSGATSYHLRQLAEHGFIVEDPERGNARERWWRAAHWTTMMDSQSTVGDDQDLGGTYLRSVAQVYADKLLSAADERDTLPEEWQDASTMSDYLLRLTPAELKKLETEVAELLRRYRSGIETDAPEGTALVSFQFQAFPHSSTLEPRAEES